MSFSMSSEREPAGRVPLQETPEDTYKKVLETGISLHRGSVGEPGGEGGSFTRYFVRQVKEGSGNGASLSM
jgi:hypothetical protein